MMDNSTKDGLLEQISLAIEQIQKQFVPGGNVIKDCQETFFLCQCVDNILHHGLKEGLISWGTEPTIWPLLEKISCSKDIEEIKILRLKTDKEKCSAWIKMAVNENLLGSYIATIKQDHNLLSNHYCEYAFLRDPVMADTVTSILNYGVANFDFQIAISPTSTSAQLNVTAKPEHHVAYDVFEQTKENGYESPRNEPEIVVSQESLKKKKRKKKKQSVKTVIIKDQDDYDGLETEIGNLDIIKRGLEENNEEMIKKHESFTSIHEDDKLFNNTDDAQSLNTIESSLAKSDQSVYGTISDVRTYSSDSSVNDHVTASTNDNTVSQTDGDQSGGLEETSNREGAFVGNGLEQYLTLNASSKSQNKGKNMGLDSLGRITDMTESRKEFNANDFLLNDSEEQSIKKNNVKTSKECEDYSSFSTTKNSSKHLDMDGSNSEGYCDSTNFQQNSKKTDLGKEDSTSKNCKEDASGTPPKSPEPNDTGGEFTRNVVSSKNEDSFSSPKSSDTIAENYDENKDESDTNEKLSETKGNSSSVSQKSETPRNAESSKEQRESNGEFSEIQSSGNLYNYRVHKVENPEFISSSYGSSSALSDFTDDDRDLNFIPGIHRMSSKSFSSSFERKSTIDSSMSFDENGFPVFESSHYTESSTSQPSSIDDGSGRFTDISSDWDMFEDLLNVEEEHFSKPDNFAGLTTREELEIAIDHYKKMIKMRKDKSLQRDDLVKKLVKLRLRLQQEKEGPPVENPKFRKILSHQFMKTEGSSGTKYFCDQCGKNIWTIWQSLFTCDGCGYHSHRKCLEQIQRPCPKKDLSSVSYILNICPDTGLDAQQYRCAECRKEIAFSKDETAEARICDYTGQYYCNNCHWNDQVIIPARVVRNWDFTPHKVCRKSKQLLELMKIRPILNIQETNPMLYRYVEELREVGKLREDILIMKKYFLTCREALQSKLLIQLEKRQHFVDSADTYSFQDLIDLNNDVLLPEVSKIHALFLAHIKADCELCRARGFICEVCRDSSDIIFAFDPHAVKCTNCSAVFHKICFKPEDCPKCERKKEGR